MAEHDFSAAEWNKAAHFAPGVTVRKTTWYNEYSGIPEDCIAAGLIAADQIPGSQGHLRKTSATYRKGSLVRQGANGDRDEHYVSVLLTGRKVAIRRGLPQQVHEKRQQIQNAAYKSERDAQRAAEQKISTNAIFADVELRLFPSDIPAYRQQIIEELRSHFRSTCSRTIQNEKQGFYFEESTFEAIDDLMEQMIEAVMTAEIKFDPAVHRNRVQELKATIAAADPKFQRSIASISKAASKFEERNES
jgi:hypothetical protein